jgi:hypothetical protein
MTVSVHRIGGAETSAMLDAIAPTNGIFLTRGVFEWNYEGQATLWLHAAHERS